MRTWFACEVTLACNLDCIFCYNDEKEQRRLDAREFGLLADSLCAGGDSPGITLTGGEPLLRMDLEEIAAAFSSRGCRVAVATNGTMLHRERVLSLVEAGVEHFDIGFTSPSHQTVMAVVHAVKSGVTVTASICIHGGNYRDTGLRTRTAAALGADSVCLNRFVPTGRGRLNAPALRLGEDQLLQALQLAQNAADACPINIYTGIPVDPGLAGSKAFPAILFTTCRCGETKWAIDPSGNLRTCEQSGSILENLLEVPFQEALQMHSEEIGAFRRSAAGGCRFLE